MSSRRDQIQMTEDEVADFLDTQKTVICASNGVNGYPHLMPLWFIVRDDELWAWTFAKSQKVKNMERDLRVTLQVEDGEEYQELRGVMLECDVVMHHDTDDVLELGLEIFKKYTPGFGDDLPEEALAMIRKQAEKRVAMQFVERRRATWDHRKLGGVY